MQASQGCSRRPAAIDSLSRLHYADQGGRHCRNISIADRSVVQRWTVLASPVFSDRTRCTIHCSTALRHFMQGLVHWQITVRNTARTPGAMEGADADGLCRRPTRAHLNQCFRSR